VLKSPPKEGQQPPTTTQKGNYTTGGSSPSGRKISDSAIKTGNSKDSFASSYQTSTSKDSVNSFKPKAGKDSKKGAGKTPATNLQSSFEKAKPDVDTSSTIDTGSTLAPSASCAQLTTGSKDTSGDRIESPSKDTTGDRIESPQDDTSVTVEAVEEPVPKPEEVKVAGKKKNPNKKRGGKKAREKQALLEEELKKKAEEEAANTEKEPTTVAGDHSTMGLEKCSTVALNPTDTATSTAASTKEKSDTKEPEIEASFSVASLHHKLNPSKGKKKENKESGGGLTQAILSPSSEQADDIEDCAMQLKKGAKKSPERSPITSRGLVVDHYSNLSPGNDYLSSFVHKNLDAASDSDGDDDDKESIKKSSTVVRDDNSSNASSCAVEEAEVEESKSEDKEKDSKPNKKELTMKNAVKQAAKERGLDLFDESSDEETAKPISKTKEETTPLLSVNDEDDDSKSADVSEEKSSEGTKKASKDTGADSDSDGEDDTKEEASKEEGAAGSKKKKKNNKKKKKKGGANKAAGGGLDETFIKEEKKEEKEDPEAVRRKADLQEKMRKMALERGKEGSSLYNAAKAGDLSHVLQAQHQEARKKVKSGKKLVQTQGNVLQSQQTLTQQRVTGLGGIGKHTVAGLRRQKKHQAMIDEMRSNAMTGNEQLPLTLPTGGISLETLGRLGCLGGGE